MFFWVVVVGLGCKESVAFEAIHVEQRAEINVEAEMMPDSYVQKVGADCANMDALMNSIVDNAGESNRRNGHEMTWRYVYLLEAQNECITQGRDAGILSALGQAYATLGKVDSARTALSAANRIDPRSWASVYVQWLTSVGDYVEAYEVLKRTAAQLLQMNPEQNLRYVIARAELLSCCYHPPSGSIGPEVLIAEIESSLEKRDQTTAEAVVLSELGVTLRIRAHFLLGKLFEQAEKYQDAIHHYIQGNEMQLARLSPISLYSADVRALLCLRDAIFPGGMPLSKIPKPIPQLSDAEPHPIFIVGCPRSGSTLIERVLGSHSQVGAMGETAFVSDNIASPLLKDITTNSTLTAAQCRAKLELSLEQPRSWLHSVDALVSAYLRSIQAVVNTSSLRYVVDKQLFNFLSIGLLSRLFPRAKFVLVSRDRVDVAASIYFTDLADLPFSYDPESIHRFFHLFDDTMAIWRQRLHIDMYEVHYERLVEGPETELRSLFSWLGLDFEPSVLDFDKQEDFVTRSKTASMHDVRKPIYPSRVNFSRPYLETVRGFNFLERFTPQSTTRSRDYYQQTF